MTGAKLVELEGKDFLFFVGDTGPMINAIEEFLTGDLPATASTGSLPQSYSLTSSDRLNTRPALVTDAGASSSRPTSRSSGRSWNVTEDAASSQPVMVCWPYSTGRAGPCAGGSNP